MELDFPIEVQLRSERQLREFWQAKAEALARRKVPPARQKIEEIERKYALLQDQYNSLDRMWKASEAVLLARIEKLSAPDIIQRLEHERDSWRDRWRNTTTRLADALEHQGNMELMEQKITNLERQNALLRAR